MASVTLPASYVGPADVQNCNGSAATVASLTIGPGFALDRATGLPGTPAINPASGVISGIYDASPTAQFSVTVAAHPNGSSLSISKAFVLTIRDDD
jgi:hypothetical protein